MSLLLGVLAGMAYGLSAFAGAFIALPLLVLAAGIGIHESLPIALFALGICAAIAAGDAVRARQCSITHATWLIVGGVPMVLIAGWLAQFVSDTILSTLFLVAAIVFGPLLLSAGRAYRHRTAPPPASLLHAPKRAFGESAQVFHFNATQRAATLFSGAGCGIMAALCAAPGSWIGWRILDRQMPGEAHLVVGTLTFSVAVVAILGAGFEFALAPEIPGYVAGLFVLGAVSGMGIARRVHHLPLLRSSNTVMGVAVIILALALWVAVVSGATPDA
ncbi:hypothetical protein SADO_01660 [Salinisphaera dokdonensis CL-ES53]|uniref:Probable membrane transporter protein n=1 Tax=Salinisphaera dokdonensis CL-ES53 TaxID=1304272 RepID=A0ABV2AWA0_9GAMM